MKKYEVMYIIRPNVEEEARKALIEEVNAIYTAKESSVDSVKEWGLKELAYEINKQRRGYYVVCTYETENPLANAEFDRICGINSNVIRHIVIKLD